MDAALDHAAATYLACVTRHGGEPVVIVGLLADGEKGCANTVASFSDAHGLRVLSWMDTPGGLGTVPSSDALYYLLNMAKMGEVGSGNQSEGEFSALYDRGIAALEGRVSDVERYPVETLSSEAHPEFVSAVETRRREAREEPPAGAAFFLAGKR